MLRGRAQPSMTLSECRSSCVNNVECTGLDWAHSSSVRCYLHGPWSGRMLRGANPGVKHYDLTRGSACGSSFDILLLSVIS